MRIVGKEKIQHLLGSNGQERVWLRAWLAEVANANWKDPRDIFDQFPKSFHVNPCTFTFPINNTDKHVCIQIAFPQGVAIIIGLQ